MKRKEDEKMELDGIELSEDMLFYGSAVKLEELVSLAGKCIEEVEGSNNVRLIILETWLFIDFCIRELLMSGLKLDGLNIDAFDLRFHLLPKSFRECIRLIMRLKDTHSNLPRDPQEKAIKLPVRFFFFLKKQYPDFFDQLLSIEQEYYRKYAPELVTGDSSEEALRSATTVTYEVAEPVQYSRIPIGWIEAVGRIDKAWFRSVSRLNEARNYAAHSYDSEQILQCMGYSGADPVAHLKDECIGLLRNLIGITKAIEEAGKSSD